VAAAPVLAGAALCALAVRERPRRRYVFAGAVLLALLPWLGWSYVVPGLVVAYALVTWALRENRRLAAIAAGEALAASLVFYATLNDRFYGGLTPRSAGAATLPDMPFGYVDRIPRLAALWLDREAGLLRWAPVLALVGFAAWLLYRSRRDQLARVVPARREAEACARLLLAVLVAEVAVTALAAAAPLRASFPGVSLAAALPPAAALSAWALRHVPRALAGALAALTLGMSAWLIAAEDPWLAPHGDAPWGPLAAIFPRFDGPAAWPVALCALIAAGVLALLAREHRAKGAWRREAAASRTSRVLH